MIILKNIWEFLNSRIFPYILAGILLIFYLNGCNKIAKERIESDRKLNNYLALKDSIRIISTKNNTLLVEKSAFEKTISELRKENWDIYTELEFERNKPPKTIIRTVIEYKDVIIIEHKDSYNPKDSTGNLAFDYNEILPGSNSFSISGNLPYSLRLKNKKNPVSFGEYKLDIHQNIDIKAGLYRDDKDKRTYIRLFTDYPNLTFKDIHAIDITDSDSKAAMKANRKEFGLGFNAGYGTHFSKDGYSNGFYMGMGLNYTPRFLQFGK